MCHYVSACVCVCAFMYVCMFVYVYFVKDFTHVLLQLANTNYCFWPHSHVHATRLFFSEIKFSAVGALPTFFPLYVGLTNVFWQQSKWFGFTVILFTQCNHLLQWKNIEPSIVTDCGILCSTILYRLQLYYIVYRLKSCMGGLAQISWRAFWPNALATSQILFQRKCIFNITWGWCFWHDIYISKSKF